MKKIKKGFTLIELLVVIAIIGILATIVIINVASARTKANDSKVMNDMAIATKVAGLCIAEDGALTAVAGVASTAAICATPGAGSVVSATATWPAFVLLKSAATTGSIWAGSATVTTSTSAFTSAIIATGAAVGDFRVTCNTNGCTKATL